MTNFHGKYFAAPALSWYTSPRSRVKKTLMSVFGLGSNAIAEELTMATDKDTTTRTAKDAAEDVTRATRSATAEAADTGKKVARDAADTAERGARTAERGAEVAQNVADRGAQTLRSTTE